ncbi:MAG: PAS domain-containing protein, partial [Tyzzerella sp.]|nr:PAS domain-containing protein [Tyzzerella sp.]
MGPRLDLLKQIAHGLAVHFGDLCEVVIHDLTQEAIEHSIVYIENGHITGRQLGDGPSRIVFDTLSSEPALIKDRLSYLTKSENGQILKSSTMYIRGEDDRIEYIFSVNFDITALLPVETAINSLISTEYEHSLAEDSAETVQPPEITHNVSDLLDSLIEQALAMTGKPVAAMTREDKIQIV